MIIRRANLEDAEKIFEIAEGNSLNKNKGIKPENGFLVSSYDLDKYKEYIINNRYFLVLEEQGILRAFLLAFTSAEINPDEIINKKIIANSDEKFIIVKQVCAAVDCHRQGYSTQLYNFLMDDIKDNIFAAVVLEPINQASIRFHEEMGFRVAFTITPEDKRKRAVFFWDNPCNSFYDKEVVLNQYERAIELYIHEDNLNWSKLNNFFYITGGIFAIATIWPKINSYINFCEALLAISFVGIIYSYLFRIALNSGIDYMLARKRAVVEVEQILIKLRGVKIVSTHYNKGTKNRRLRKSPTSRVMKNIPLIMLIFWSAVFLYALVKYLIIQF